ncbi:MAG: DPP IV N-terminal domain-containing protein [Bacteroidales bacterium]|nr:DPP IV N-terminal domain-containing protein [Bacteroidales bacterium]
MRKILLPLLFLSLCLTARSQEYNPVPMAWKWMSDTEVAFSYDGSYTDTNAFRVALPALRLLPSTPSPATYTDFPVRPEGAVNLTWSPDSTMLAFTRDNNLFVYDLEAGREKQLTFDGSDVILNGYASWVYYEEIFGRPSRYKAFWWSPDSRRIGFYRFDNGEVPMFPIYSHSGQDGTLNRTRYPKAGETNPEVRIGMIDVRALPFGAGAKKVARKTVWADFDPSEDQYFGTPFWGPDGESFYIAREPRIQNTLDLYRVSARDGSKTHVYHETYKTWLSWIEDVLFTEKGLYMARSFEGDWQQIYFLSYDGQEFRRLTDGPNWRMHLLRVDEAEGTVYFTAHRDATTRACLYRVDAQGRIVALTDPRLGVSGVRFSPDGQYFVAALSNFTTPTQVWLYETRTASLAWKNRRLLEGSRKGMHVDDRAARSAMKVADAQGPEFDPSAYALPQLVTIPATDGLMMPAAVTYPKDFDPSRKYPVHFEIYGGPNTAYVRDMWRRPTPQSQWWSGQGIIHVVADCRASGHNGRAGTDQVYRNLTDVPVQDFLAWAAYFRSLPYVDAARIGVEGFSFGGTMTAMLLLRHSDVFCCGIAGGGVYDWALYDSHYTERFMETPRTNPEGYRAARVLNYVEDYPVPAGGSGSVMLKLTHGTGDDNVHFQNTLQLVDALQQAGKGFRLMIYPDGMHGYRGKQAQHSLAEDRDFWLRYLKD